MVPFFFYFARPTPALLAVAAGLMIVGLSIRAWAAGTIHKDRALSTTGPYAHTRNPLYLGTFFLGAGAVVASGQPWFGAVFVVLFAWIYGASMHEEATRLAGVFGDEYAAFADAVPLFVPRLTPARLGNPPGGFDPARWKKNREYEALIGAVVVWALLAAKMFWLG